MYLIEIPWNSFLSRFRQFSHKRNRITYNTQHVVVSSGRFINGNIIWTVLHACTYREKIHTTEMLGIIASYEVFGYTIINTRGRVVLYTTAERITTTTTIYYNARRAAPPSDDNNGIDTDDDRNRMRDGGGGESNQMTLERIRRARTGLLLLLLLL